MVKEKKKVDMWLKKRGIIWVKADSLECGELTTFVFLPLPPSNTVDNTKDHDEDEEETIQRGLDTYPEDKDRQNVAGGATGAGAGGSATGTTVEKGNEVLIMNAKNDDRTTSFFSQPGILAGKKLIDGGMGNMEQRWWWCM